MERFVSIDSLKIVPPDRRSLTLAVLGFGMTWWGVTAYYNYCTESVQKHLSSLSIQSEESMLSLINQLIAMGLNSMHKNQHAQKTPFEAHCHYLIIQMNALIKNISAEMLEYNQDDFERLKQAAGMKYKALS